MGGEILNNVLALPTAVSIAELGSRAEQRRKLSPPGQGQLQSGSSGDYS